MQSTLSAHAVNQALNDSFLYCRQLTYKNSNFYLGMAVASKEIREAFYAIYAWLHTLDNIIDDECCAVEEKLKKLKLFVRKTHVVLKLKNADYCHQLKDKFWLAFRKTMHTHRIPFKYLEGMIAGQVQDLTQNCYKTFSELYNYCYYVASTVGLMCIHIWGFKENSEAEKMAEWCGIAFQLTNILRDIKVDAKLNRIYLPTEFVGMEKISSSDFEQLSKENLLKTINELIVKADEYYSKSMDLHKFIHDNGKLSLYLFVNYYKALFDKIRANPECVISGEKIKLSKLHKLKIYMTALIKYKWFAWFA